MGARFDSTLAVDEEVEDMFGLCHVAVVSNPDGQAAILVSNEKGKGPQVPNQERATRPSVTEPAPYVEIRQTFEAVSCLILSLCSLPPSREGEIRPRTAGVETNETNGAAAFSEWSMRRSRRPSIQD